MSQAVLFIAGSGQHILDQSVGLIADRVARGLVDGGAERDADLRYTIEVSKGAHTLPTGVGLDIAKIAFTDAGRANAPVREVDVIALDYLPHFVKPFADLNPAMRVVRAFRAVLRNLPRALGALSNRDTPRGNLDKGQAIVLGLMVLVSLASLAYWVLLLATGVGGIEELITPESEEQSFLADALGWLAAIVAGLTLIRFTFKDFIDAIEKTAIDFYSTMDYVADENEFGAILTAVDDFLGYVEGKGYETTDLVSFSLGSILSTDTIFARSAKVRTKKRKIRCWITIGNPFDILASVDPNYFREREAAKVEFTTWINVLTEHDYLGSNFRPDQQPKDPDKKQGIYLRGQDSDPRQPDRNVYFTPGEYWHDRSSEGIFGRIYRIATHSLYWNARDARTPTCFGKLAAEVGWLDEILPPRPGGVTHPSDSRPENDGMVDALRHG